MLGETYRRIGVSACRRLQSVINIVETSWYTSAKITSTISRLFLRPTLVIGVLLMLLLIFGTTLIQQWDIASIQMIYVAFYAMLLSTIGYDRFSLDGLRRRK